MVAEATIILSVLTGQQGVRLTLHKVAIFLKYFVGISSFYYCNIMYAPSQKKNKKNNNKNIKQTESNSILDFASHVHGGCEC